MLCKLVYICLLGLLPALSTAVEEGSFNRSSFRIAHEVKPIPVNAAEPQCAPSHLGYECSWLVCDRIRLHWSLGGSAPNGSAPCSYDRPNRTSTVGALDSNADIVHFAVQSELMGYIAMSFAYKYGVMSPADAVVGQVVGGVGSVAPYYVTGYTQTSVKVDAGVNLQSTGAVVSATANTICFSRLVHEKGQGAIMTGKPAITLEPGKFNMMNFVAGFSRFPSTHSMAEGRYMCSAAMPLVAEVVPEPEDRRWVPGPGVTNSFDPAAAAKEVEGHMTDHGILMMVAWLLLMPLGILAARHKTLVTEWASSSADSGLIRPGATGGGAALWFLLHRILQGSAAVLALAGFILPFTSFDEDAGDDEHSAGHESHLTSARAHSVIGFGLMTVLGVHLVLALARPKPDAPRRRVWNLLHLWAGRLLTFVAAINVSIGISLWRMHVGSGEESVGKWVACLILLLVGFVAADVALTVVRRRRERSAAALEDGNSGGGELSMARLVANGGGISGVLASTSGYDRIDSRAI